MVDVNWVSGVIAAAVCLGAGVMAVARSRGSQPAAIFLFAMIALSLSMSIGDIYNLLPSEQELLGNVLFKVKLASLLVALGLVLDLALIFPSGKEIRLRPPNTLGIVSVVAVAYAAMGLFAGLDYSGAGDPVPSTLGKTIQDFTTFIMIALTTAVVLLSLSKAAKDDKRSAGIFLLGLWIWAVTGIVHGLIDKSWSFLILSSGITVAGVLFFAAMASGRMVISTPVAERMVSSSKSQFNLLRRNVYLVNEPKADFAFKMFTDILRGRCYDCENDDSFPCESIDCTHCNLPCPCRECAKYSSRSQGFVVTRRFPNDIRKAYYIQTTPILWLSTVAGPESMDPAKLSLLTDYLVNFMEKSQNGVVLVDGLEYLVTSNDFSRVLKAVDRWTEVAMTSNARLIISVDGRAFDSKELAMLESSRNVVRPDARERWKVIPERI